MEKCWERNGDREILSDCVVALTAYSDMQTMHCDSQSCTRPRQSSFIPTLGLFLSTSVSSLVQRGIKEIQHFTAVHSLKDEKIRKIFVSVEGFAGSIVQCIRKFPTKSNRICYE
jgi:hypothetical protein